MSKEKTILVVAPQGPGYHIRKIVKGVIGESSKIYEELQELEDSEEQGVRLMALIELSDMYGTIQRYLEKHFPDVTMDDLKQRSENTNYCVKRTRQNIAGTSKIIRQEIRAFQLAERKGGMNSLSARTKLARVYGAMDLYLRSNYPGMYFTDLVVADLQAMSRVTRRAFENGHRS
ncbi:MAG: hypothetical protein K2X81_15195 [Candidatus Obscuribacterales bacterium]|nr:hypothetical protein [Candidatus Obscuribacterales bacterium]